MTLGLSLDSLTSVSPMCMVIGVMPDSMGVHNNSGSWDPLNLHNTNDAHLPGSGRISRAHSTPRAYLVLPYLLPGEEGRGRKEAELAQGPTSEPQKQDPVRLFLPGSEGQR